MANVIEIEREGDGAVYEVPAGTAIPEGFRQVGGSASRTTTSEGLMGSLYDMMRGVGRGYEDWIAKPATGAITSALQTLPFSADPGTQDAIVSGAKYLFPQTTTGAGIAAGALASGGLGVIPGIMGAAAGGLIGGGLEPQAGAPNMGFAQGAVAGGIGEALGYGAGVVRRHFGQQAADEANVGRAIGEISPTLGVQPNAAALQDRLKGASGRRALSAEYQSTRDQIGQQVASNPIAAPSGGALEQLTGKVSMTFEEAAAAIEALRAGRHPLTTALTGSAKGAVERDLKRQAADELASALNTIDPTLGVLFREAEHAYGRGSELIRLFRQKGVLDPQLGGLNMPALQSLMGEKQELLERMLGPGGWETLKRVVYRGGEPPGMDQARGLLPMRAYINPPGMTGLSEGFRVPLPKAYVGPNQLQVPSLPFTLGANTTVERRNPFRR